MKLLHLIPYFIRSTKSGGPAIALQRLASVLIDHGNDITIVCSTGNLDTDVDLNFDGNEYITLEQEIPTVYMRRKNYFFPPTFYFSPNLPRWLDKHIGEYDIVTLHGPWTYFSLAGWRACCSHNKPYLQYLHGSLDPWALKYHWWKKLPYWYAIERKVFNQAAGIIAVTQDEMHIIKQKGIHTSVRVIPYGVSVERPDGLFDELIYNKWPQLKGKNYVLFMSRLHEKKGLDILLPAWADVQANFPEFILVISGGDEGGYQDKLESMSNDLKIHQSVVFTGHISGDLKNSFLKNASLFILPSYSEGLPNAVLEAMATRLPVIITPGCHLPEVEQYQAGLIVPLDILSISNALQKLLSNPELRMKMGENAFQLVHNKFSKEKIGNDFEDWCLEILEKWPSKLKQ